MPKVTIEFDLDNPEKDDRREFERMIKATDLCGCLWDFEQYLRGIVKHGDPDQNPTIEQVREKLWEEINSHGINLDGLWT